VVAGDQLTLSLDKAAAHIAIAERRAELVPRVRRHRFQVALALARLSRARRRGDSLSVLDEVRDLLNPTREQTDAVPS
jgi:hypothetical protein